jgi:hypothetical protein
MLPWLSGQGQRTGTHSACSRCDSYMKGFQPSRHGQARLLTVWRSWRAAARKRPIG